MEQVIDAFSFFNECDLLEIRLNELWDVVDRFVIVEATRTHTGKIKPLYYWKEQDRFKKFESKIVHISIDTMPMTRTELELSLSSKDKEWLASGYQRGDNWVRERYQRNEMMRFVGMCDPDDIVIIEDADELVRAEVLQNIRSTIVDGSNAVEQVFHTYYLNFQCTNMPWYGSKILRKKFITTPSEDRFHTPATAYIKDGGWHFNFLGGAKAIKIKLQAYAHDEFCNEETFSKLEERLKNKQDAIGRLYQYKIVPIDESYPRYLRENLDKYKHLLYKETQ